MDKKNGFGAVQRALRNPNYRTYVIGNTTSHFGQWAQRIAVGWLTWELTKSGTWLGLIAVADLFPTVILSPLAGAFADRVDRLMSMRIAMFASVVQGIILAVLMVTGLITIELILGLTLALGVIMAVNHPVRLSLAPLLVSRADLPAAIGINSLVYNMARVGGPALGGFFILNMGVEAAFLFNAMSYAVFVFVLFRVRLMVPHKPGGKRSIGNLPAEIMEGYRYAARHPGIGPLLVLLTGVALFARPFMDLLPGIADAVFGRGAEGLAWLTSMVGVGATAGGLWLAQRDQLDGLTRITISHALLFALSVIAFTATDNFIFALACAVVAGWASVVVGVGEQTLIQASVDSAVRGRVISIYGMVSRGGPSFGALVMGYISEFAGLRWPVAGGALLCLALWLWAHRRRAAMSAALEVIPTERKD
ncbi:MAG: MFS transporter [Alphaproteobacteria bacterium]